ncbi:MAG: acyltransferase family protein [Candidatus Thiodiazotropha sp.]
MEDIKYRRDIDGLRGISVMAVVLYHYQLLSITGGFVGVDIFFVISGFLITSIIAKEIDSNRFSFLEFYSRRIRRILPALLVVIVATLVFCYFLILPMEYQRVGESAVYAVFGLSNFYFLFNTDYFDSAAEFQPFLHTWSLGVEEQYYLLWPLILFVVMRVTRTFHTGRVLAVAAIIILSLVTSAILVDEDQKSAFYMLQSRAWELGIGGLFALLPVYRSRLGSTILSILALALISWPLFSYDAETPFPGIHAAVVCLGAGLIIWPKHHNWVAALLSSSPLVALGKISYSLYLWHWPVLVLYRQYGTGSMPGTHLSLILLFVSVLLSVASWVYVEEYFRRGKAFKLKMVYATGVSAMLMVGALALSIVLGSGFPCRLPENLQNVDRMITETVSSQNGFDECFITTKTVGGVRAFSRDTCLNIDKTRKNVLLVGDSHAAHFGKALRDLYPEVHFSQVTGSGCMPKLHAEGPKPCAVLMRLAIDETIPEGKYDAVIFSARWMLKDIPALMDALTWTEQYVDNVLLFGPTIEYSKALPTLMAKSALRDDGGVLVKRALRYRNTQLKEKRIMQALPDRNIEYYSVFRALCSGKNCRNTDDNGAPIQFDYGHLTYLGAKIVIDKFKNNGMLNQLNPSGLL